MFSRSLSFLFLSSITSAWCQSGPLADTIVATNDPAPRATRVLYFSQQNNSHHRPADFVSSVRDEFGQQGIIFETSILASKISDTGLAGYDGVFFFGNHNPLSSASEQALVDYVEAGGGVVGMHVFAYVVRNSSTLRNLLGGGFHGHHAISSFTPVLIQSPSDFPSNLDAHPFFPFSGTGNYQSDPTHPILDGLETYTSFDEPYLHANLNPDLILLSYRDESNGWAEPYTWVRHQGAGRIFYHANGHDSRTWNEPNFRDLMIRGTHWAANNSGGGPHATFYPPIISADGSIQYFSSAGGGGNTSLALYSENAETASTDQQIPGNDESFKYKLDAALFHSRSDSGDAAFNASVEKNSSIFGALFAGHPRYPTMIARAGGQSDSLVAGFSYQNGQSFPFKSNQSGAILYFAEIEDSAGLNQKSGIALHNTGSTQPLLIEGDSLATDPNLIVQDLSGARFGITDSGRISVIAELQDGQASTEVHLLAGTQNTLTSWVRAGAVVNEISGDPIIDQFESATPLNAGSVVFAAKVAGPSTTSSNNQIIASADSGGNIALLFQEGTAIDSQNVSFPESGIVLRSWENRSIALGTVSGNSALLELPTGGAPRLLLVAGESLSIDGSVRTLLSINSASLMASAKDVLIPATFLEADGLTTTECLLHIGPAGIPRPVMMSDWQIETSSGPLIVDTVFCSQVESPGSGLNASGEAAFMVRSASGSEAIMKVSNLDDLDQDGISDTIETAFGGDPTIYSAQLPEGLPIISSVGASDVEFSFWQIQSSPLTDNYRVEASADLQMWTEISASFTPDPDQTGVSAGYIRMNVVLPGASTTRFYRFAL